MPLIPGTYDRATHTGEVTLQGVSVRLPTRAAVEQLARDYGTTVIWPAQHGWPHEVTVGGADGSMALARLGAACRELTNAVRACRALGERLDQAVVDALLAEVGRSVGDY